MTDIQNQLLPNPFDHVEEITATDDIRLTDMEKIKREIINENEETSNEPNFPFFYPIVYHNISNDIPPFYSKIVSMAYLVSISFTFSLIVQFLGTFFSKNIKNTSYGSSIVASLVQIIILPILLFYLQYFPFYKSIKYQKRSSSTLKVQLFVIFIFLLEFIGIPSTGSIGIVYLFSRNEKTSIICSFFGYTLTFWHLVDLLCEIILFFRMKPLFVAIQQQI